MKPRKSVFSVKAAVAAWSLTMSLAGFCGAAAPIETVPWNGHVGAVSFTFDDALENQVQNLTPILDELKDVHVTFFVTSMGNGIQNNAAGFANLAKAGHEIGNHTDTHAHLSGISDNSELENEIVKFADKIESTMAENGAKVRVTSLATPFCENNDKIKSVINKRHFINRDCGWHGRNEWDVEPEWLSIQAKVWTRSGASVEELLSSLDTAAFIGNFEGAKPWEVSVKGGSWLVVLNHGVTDDKGDDYAINPEDIKKLFKHALENDLWTAPFGTIGAYHRAHFIVDKAEKNETENGYTVQWEIPNEHMPESVPLRVKIDTKSVDEKAIVEQDGKILKQESDGTYIIEFMAKALTVRKPKEGEKNPQDSTTAIAQNPKFEREYTNFTLFDMNGNKLGAVDNFAVPERFPKGTYIIRAESKGHPSKTVKMVHK
ncbi:polysaccharide deacetylase family protein [Fibrobacter sp. UWB11]|uniref:polysaccharide deacetylase family protein n=1 Tax=Fibrobacter sp. UWB11 TaxID=1896202 RepID=UPI00094096DE|nr:polysaccharide deacetylase family protein [Fibrobacter sp. UWB11]